MRSVISTVTAALGVAEWVVRETRPGELTLEADAATLPTLADRVVHGMGGRLMSLFASDERSATGRFVVHQIWSLPEHRTFLHIASPIDPATPSYPSIAAKYPAANWFEREVMDFFGLVAEGHPNPARVALHDDWPDGVWPLRKDFPDDRVVPRVPGAFHPFRPVTGEGVFQVPVGPVHAGIIEPGHFRFGVAGEPILAARPKPDRGGQALGRRGVARHRRWRAGAARSVVQPCGCQRQRAHAGAVRRRRRLAAGLRRGFGSRNLAI